MVSAIPAGKIRPARRCTIRFLISQVGFSDTQGEPDDEGRIRQTRRRLFLYHRVPWRCTGAKVAAFAVQYVAFRLLVINRIRAAAIGHV
jgi:hypothetical protein